MLGFEPLQLVQQPIELGVGDLRGVVNVIAFFVVPDLLAELLNAVERIGHSGVISDRGRARSPGARAARRALDSEETGPGRPWRVPRTRRLSRTRDPSRGARRAGGGSRAIAPATRRDRRPRSGSGGPLLPRHAGAGR